MAKAASYSTSGNREDISDIITTLEPESTPFISMAKKATASGTFFEVPVYPIPKFQPYGTWYWSGTYLNQYPIPGTTDI